MSETTGLLLQLFLVFVAAKIAAEVFHRIHQPAVIGELLVGMLIGPFALGLVGLPDEAMVGAFHGDARVAAEATKLVQEVISELGVIVLLFFVGLETRVSDILRVGGRAGTVALLGVVLPFGLGYLLMGPVLGRPLMEAIFVGTAMVATSVGITARVLRDLGVIASRESRIILGAAVIDDIIGMVILAIVAGMGATGSISWLSVGVIGGQALLFTAFVSLVGTGAMRRWGGLLTRLRMDNAPFAVALVTMLGLAVASASIGLAAIIGAFLAGMVFAELPDRFEIEHQALPLYQFLVPFFFVLTGAQVDWRLFLRGDIMGLALGVTLLALVGKLVGCGLGAAGLGRRSMAIVGVGMAPRGEVGLIVASLGLSLGAITQDLFSVVVVMSILTTLVVPPVLRLLYRGDPETELTREDIESAAGLLPDL